MGNKRIYLGRESSKYAETAGGAIITITSLFFVLMVMGFEITGTDDICLGTLDDPCVSYGKICNLGPDNFDIYNPDEVKLDFSPTIKNYWIFFKDGRVKKEFLFEQGVNHSTKGWRYENFTNATKPRKDRVYVHRFARYSCQEYMLVGLKENPDDVIKWGVGVGAEYLDPFWYGENESEANISVSNNLILELGSKVNITTNLTGATTVCVDIDHPDYGDEYVCGSPNAQFTFNISYFRKNELNDSSTSKNLTYAAGGNQSVYLVGHQYDEINNFTINLTGALYGGNYPENVKVYINNTLSNSIGPLRPSGETITLKAFNDTAIQTSEADYYIETNKTVIKYLKIPKGANVTYASFNYTGLTNWTGSSFYGQVADAEASDCTEQDCGTGGTAQTSAYDSNNATYSYSYSCGSDTGEYSDYQLNYTHNVTTPAKITWGLQFEFNAYDSAAFRRIYYAQCYDYSTSAWTNIEQFTLYGGNPNYEKMWFRSYTLTNEESYAGCLTTTPVRLRTHFTKVGGSTYCSTIKVYELDTQESSSKGVSWWNSTDFPQNMTIEVGAVDGTWEGNQSGEVNSSHQTDDFNDTITSWLSTCIADSDGYCNIPVYITSDGEGKFKIHNIIVNYTYNPNPIVLDTSLVSSFLGNETGFSDIKITLYSNTTGIINIKDIRDDYKGGNDTIEVFTWEKNATWNAPNSLSCYEANIYWTPYACVASTNTNDTNFSTGSWIGQGWNSYAHTWFKWDEYSNFTRTSAHLENSTYIHYEFKINDYGSGANWNDGEDYANVSCYNGTTWLMFENTTALDYDVGVNTNVKNTTLLPNSCLLSTIQLKYNLYVRTQEFGGNPDYGFMEDELFVYDNKANNDTLNLLVYFSNFFKNLPYTWTEYIFFLPKTNSSKDVNAYGQTTTNPIYNITTTNYGGNMKLVMFLSESFSCLDIYASTNNTKPMISLWDGLVAYWSFDVDARDDEGDNNGTIIGATHNDTGGQIGGAYEFDGNDIIEISPTNLSGEFTISYWTYVSSYDSVYRFSLSYGAGTNKIGQSSNAVKFFIRILNGGFSDTSINLPDVGWHKVVLTRDSSDKVDLYVDNGPANRLFSDVAQTGDSNWTIIGAGQTTAQYFDGTIDELKMYNRSLSSAEVLELYDRSYNKYYDVHLSESWQTFGNNIPYLDNQKIWLWADFDNCNASDQRILQPSLEVNSYCMDCSWE